MERPHIGRCVLAAGNPAAGIILYRLIFWKPTRQINGRWWFAKSYAEIAYETGLSLKQVENGLARLRKRGLIQTSQHLFQGKSVTHVLVTEECRQTLMACSSAPPKKGTQVPPKEVAQVPPKEGTQEPPNGGTSYTTYMQGEPHGVQQGDCALTCAENTGDPQSSLIGEGKRVKPKKTRLTSVKDVLLAHKGPSQKDVLHKPESLKQLEFTWKTHVSDVFDKYVAPLTLKQQNQLKKFREKCPPGKADAVLKSVIENWVGFVKTVQAQAGLKQVPPEPSLDFLLKHAEVAVNLSLDLKKPVVTQEAAPKGEKSASAVQLIAEEEDKPQTFEELMAIIGEEPSS